MRHSLSVTRLRNGKALLPLVVSLLLLALPMPIFASESCSMMGGTCRDVCGKNEQAESGAFEDCGAKQECCVARAEAKALCCITSFDTRDFGPSNCRVPEGGVCAKGSGSPVPCQKLPMCGEKK